MVCVTPRVEPEFWLGDKITEAQPHQPGLQPPATPRLGGTDGLPESQGSRIFLPRALLGEIRTTG